MKCPKCGYRKNEALIQRVKKLRAEGLSLRAIAKEVSRTAAGVLYLLRQK